MITRDTYEGAAAEDVLYTYICDLMAELQDETKELERAETWRLQKLIQGATTLETREAVATAMEAAHAVPAIVSVLWRCARALRTGTTGERAQMQDACLPVLSCMITACENKYPVRVRALFIEAEAVEPLVWLLDEQRSAVGGKSALALQNVTSSRRRTVPAARAAIRPLTDLLLSAHAAARTSAAGALRNLSIHFAEEMASDADLIPRLARNASAGESRACAALRRLGASSPRALARIEATGWQDYAYPFEWRCAFCGLRCPQTPIAPDASPDDASGERPVALNQCAACLSAHYCSRACQRSAWPLHKASCKRLRSPTPGLLALMGDVDVVQTLLEYGAHADVVWECLLQILERATRESLVAAPVWVDAIAMSRTRHRDEARVVAARPGAVRLSRLPSAAADVERKKERRRTPQAPSLPRRSSTTSSVESNRTSRISSGATGSAPSPRPSATSPGSFAPARATASEADVAVFDSRALALSRLSGEDSNAMSFSSPLVGARRRTQDDAHRAAADLLDGERADDDLKAAIESNSLAQLREAIARSGDRASGDVRAAACKHRDRLKKSARKKKTASMKASGRDRAARPDPEPATPDPEPATPDPEPASPDPEPASPDPEPASPDPDPDPELDPADAKPVRRPDPNATMPSLESVSDEHSATDTSCVICLEQPRNATLVHGDSGHLCCCLACAKDLKAAKAGCPICRQDIDLVIRQFFC